MTETTWNRMKFSDEDIVNLDDWIPEGEYNPHKVRPFLISGIYGVCAVVFADCVSSALDIAADGDKLRGYLVSDEDMAEKNEEEREGLAYLGNYGDPYNINDLVIVDLPNPHYSKKPLKMYWDKIIQVSFCSAFNSKFVEEQRSD